MAADDEMMAAVITIQSVYRGRLAKKKCAKLLLVNKSDPAKLKEAADHKARVRKAQAIVRIGAAGNITYLYCHNYRLKRTQNTREMDA